MNGDHSIIFETASKYCISDCFVYYDGYSISSKGFLRFTGVAMNRYPMSKVRSGICALLDWRYTPCPRSEKPQ